jgi:hypothetical protein
LELANSSGRGMMVLVDLLEFIDFSGKNMFLSSSWKFAALGRNREL